MNACFHTWYVYAMETKYNLIFFNQVLKIELSNYYFYDTLPFILRIMGFLMKYKNNFCSVDDHRILMNERYVYFK